MNKFLTFILGALLLAILPTDAKAETFDTCRGYITALPATITLQGTWCFNKDLATSNPNVVAIDIQTNNVTIDCNGYKLGGQSAGENTQSIGFRSIDHINITIRNCTVRGYQKGISITGNFTSGHVLENNRADFSTRIGIEIEGSGSTVRHNTITETGGGASVNYGRGMSIGAGVDVMDNLIDGVYRGQVGATGVAYGIYSYDSGTVMKENRIRNVTAGSGGSSYGIYANGPGLRRASQNDLFGLEENLSWGIFCDTQDSTSLSDNYMANFDVGYKSCSNDGGNVVR